jgi:hypothetical protein
MWRDAVSSSARGKMAVGHPGHSCGYLGRGYGYLGYCGYGGRSVGFAGRTAGFRSFGGNDRSFAFGGHAGVLLLARFPSAATFR